MLFLLLRKEINAEAQLMNMVLLWEKPFYTEEMTEWWTESAIEML